MDMKWASVLKKTINLISPQHLCQTHSFLWPDFLLSGSSPLWPCMYSSCHLWVGEGIFNEGFVFHSFSFNQISNSINFLELSSLNACNKWAYLPFYFAQILCVVKVHLFRWWNHLHKRRCAKDRQTNRQTDRLDWNSSWLHDFCL